MRKNFKRKVLKNGMTVLFEKRAVPVVSVAFAVRNGGVNEHMDEKGISHFIEHMLYKGTEKRSVKQIAEEIERNGGDMNGFTSETITAYWCKMPSKHLNVALDVLGDMVRNPKLDKEELEKEMQVIFEEIKMYHDNPRMYVFHELGKSLYEPELAIDIAGTYETMGSIDREKMVEKFKEIYTSNNMILCVVGDAKFEDVVKYAEDNFGERKGGVPKFEIKEKNRVRIEKRNGIEQANLVFAYHVPFGKNKMKYAAQVLSALMAEGMSSRLFSEIREKRNLAYAVKGGSEITKDFGYNFVYVGTMKENVEKVKELILKEFEKVAEELDEKELAEVKSQMIGQWEIGMEESQSQMVNLLCSEVDGNAGEFYDFGENVSEVKLEDVKKLALEVKKGFSFFALVPE